MSHTFIVKLKALSRSQIELIEDFRIQEEQLPEIIKKGDWNHVQEHLVRLEGKAHEIVDVSSKVEDIYRKLREEHNVVPQHPSDEVLGASHGRLLDRVSYEDRLCLQGIEAQRNNTFNAVKKTTEGLNHYFNTVSKTMSSILDELIPQRKEYIYTSNGKLRKK